MIELKLRGYVTPEDFGGDVQTAIDKAEQLDIRKVVLSGDYTCGTLILPGYTHLIINGTLKADLHSKKGCGWCDEQDRYFLEGGKLDGSIYLYNTRRAVVQNMVITGDVTYEFSRDMRMEHCTVEGELKIGRGCANGILQYLTVGSAAISRAWTGISSAFTTPSGLMRLGSFITGPISSAKRLPRGEKAKIIPAR